MPKFIKIIFVFLLLAIFPILFSGLSKAQEKTVNIYLFWSKNCPHCVKEKVFLQDLENDNSEVKVHYLEITNSRANQQIFKNIGERLNTSVTSVPFLLIGDDYIVGYGGADTTGKEIVKLLENYIKDPSVDLVAELSTGREAENSGDTSNGDPLNIAIEKENNETIKLPFFGTRAIKQLSLPALTVALGVLDGFNPCAMWVLLFLISVLLGIPDSRKRWILGGTFLLTSGIIYFLFMAAWLNIFLFLGYTTIIRIAIGIAALGIGSYYLYDYYQNNTSCKIVGAKKRKLIFSFIDKVTHTQKLLFAMLGMSLLAIVVNLIELLCSAGLPAIYTKALTLSNLNPLHYYLYIAVYVFFFIVDDIIVFVLAMKSLDVLGVESKYQRLAHLIGGILIVLIGLAMIFKPELLTFA